MENEIQSYLEKILNSTNGKKMEPEFIQKICSLFDFFRNDTDRFFTNLNNLILNKMHEKVIYHFLYRFAEDENSLRAENAKNEKKDFLPAELSSEEMLLIFKLFSHFNEKPYEFGSYKSYDDPTRYYVHKVEIIEWFYRDFFAGLLHNPLFPDEKNPFENTKKEPSFSDAVSFFADKIEKYPAFAILLEKSTSRLSIGELQFYFPCKQKNEMLNDWRIFEKLLAPKFESGNFSRLEAMVYSSLASNSFRNDTQDKKSLSNKKMKLLQKIFVASLWRYIINYEEGRRNGESLIDDKQSFGYKETVDFIFLRIKDGTCFSSENFAKMLNLISKFNFLNKENPFTKVDFAALNKSLYFESNEAILHLYYTLSHFWDFDSCRNVILEMFDFVREAQLRILPIKEDLKNKGKWFSKFLPENAKKIRELDVGFTLPFLYQLAVPYNAGPDCFIKRPDFTFRLWSESKQKFDKNGKNQNWYKFNKLCLSTHFFHSADRNMETHFCTHHVLSKVMRESKTLLQILHDAGEYLNKIEDCQFENCLGVKFLKEKYEFITSNIMLIAGQQRNSFDALFGTDGKLKLDFDLREDFGEEFYNTVENFLSIMLTAQSDWFISYRFEVLAYLIYITISLVKEDSDSTEDEMLDFEVNPEDRERWKKTVDFQNKMPEKHNIVYVGGYDASDAYNPYSIFAAQFANDIKSENFEQFSKLPVSAKIHLYNGEFEKLPKYIQQMSVVIEDAKKLLTLRKISRDWENYRESYKKIVVSRWNEFVNCEKIANNTKQSIKQSFIVDTGFCNWSGNKEIELDEKQACEKLAYDFNPNKEKIRNIDYSDEPEKLATSFCESVEKNGINQVIVSTGIQAAHIQLSLVFSKDFSELEVYLDEKRNPDEKPLFSLSASNFREIENFFAILKEKSSEDFQKL